MTTCKIALKNIRKSIKDYTIYFFTLMLGVSLFYVFNAIDSQTAMLIISEDTREIVRIMTDMLSAISAFVAAVLGFLIIYASRFMMKRRAKEFGLYMILGMGKRRVSRILFVETLMIGIISLFTGLLLGIFLSQITSIFVARLFEADMSGYQFVFSMKAFDKTIIYFLLIYVIVILFNTVEVSRSKLLNLLQEGKKAERVIRVHPFVSVVSFICSVLTLAYAYITVGMHTRTLSQQKLEICIILGVVATLVFFWSFSGMLFKIITLRKKSYYKGLNTFVFRQFSSQANTNVVSMSIICLMFFITICVLISSLNLRDGMNSGITQYCPADVMVDSPLRESDMAKLTSAEEHLKKELDSNIDFTIYEGGFDLCFGEDSFSVVTDYAGKSSEVKANELYQIHEEMTVSDYNKIADYYGLDRISLQEDQYTIVANFNFTKSYFNSMILEGMPLSMNGQRELKPMGKAAVDGFYSLESNAANVGFVVVPDDYVTEEQKMDHIIVGKYGNLDKKEAVKKDAKVKKIMKNATGHGDPEISTKSVIAEASIGVSAYGVFIALYVGFIFLISGAAILAIKELSESADNKARYMMLRKLGADDRMINGALFRQIGFFFIMPLSLAVIHSIAGMKFALYILEMFQSGSIAPSIAMTAVIFGIVYGGYFLITYFTSRQLVREDN